MAEGMFIISYDPGSYQCFFGMHAGADGEDLPPPLEDMSEQLEKMKQHRMKLLQPSSELSKDKTKVKAAPSADQPSSEHSKDKTKVETAPSAGRGKSSEGSGFGGLRKGFLSGSSSKTPTVAGDLSSKTRPRSKSDKPKSNGTDNPANLRTSSGVDDIIHPKVSGKSSGLEFPEVQEAMKESFPFLNTESKRGNIMEHLHASFYWPFWCTISI